MAVYWRGPGNVKEVEAILIILTLILSTLAEPCVYFMCVRIHSQHMQEIFLFFKIFRLNLGPTYSPS
jgi:hypothetical protein